MNGVILWLLGVSPVILLFLLIGILQMKTEKAAAIALCLAVVVSFFAGETPVGGILVDCIKGLWSALPILLVIWPAIYLYEILNHTKALSAIRNIAMKSSKDQLFLILFFAWLFSSFLQGITGFGVPVAVCAPILIALGVKAEWSIIITLLGHAWANTYGTFALGWQALMLQSVTEQSMETAIYAGVFLWIVNFIGGLMICWLYGKGKAVAHMLPFLLIISSIQGGGELLVSLVNPIVAAFIPATVALIVGFLMVKLGFYKKSWEMETVMMHASGKAQSQEISMKVRTSLAPFLFLTVISIVILMVKPVNAFLSQVTITFSLPETVTGRGFYNPAVAAYNPIHIFTHAGFVLLLTVLFTYYLYKKKGHIAYQNMPMVHERVLKKVIPVSLGILFLVMMSQVLRGSGMLQVIAQGATGVFGKMYGLIVPFLGILGAFITSSNTSSNILLGAFQMSAARLLNMNEAMILAGQTAGAAIGTVLGPTTILLGTTTANCRGKEGQILKKVFPIALLETLLIGILIFAMITVSN